MNGIKDREESTPLQKELQIISKDGGEDVIDSINEPLYKDKLSALGETLELRLRQAELRLREAEVDLKKAEIDDRKQDREERKKYAIRIFGLLIGYIFFVVLMLFGTGYWGCGFSLSDNLLIALVTTTTANIIGIYTIVARYLFPTKVKD